MSSLIRTRWAAIGAAIAITVGAGGGFGFARATITSGERPVYRAMTPCRILDTRPAPNTVGTRTAKLGPAETYPVDADGASGNCTIPGDAVALVLNVTAVGATQQTNLRIFPSDASLPTASNLNPSPGSPPTPNAVTTDLSADGRFSVYNAAGNVHVVIDVAGYYADHNHDDRYYTEAQTDAIVEPLNDIAEVVLGAPSAGYSYVSEYNGASRSFTTTRPGRLDIRLQTTFGVLCNPTAGAQRIAFLAIDGVPIPTSQVAMTSGTQRFIGALAGVTTAPIAPGPHTVQVKAECLGADIATVNAVAPPAIVTVLVLDE